MMKFITLAAWTASFLAAQSGPQDIFLLIGQSNMAGRGIVEAQDKQPIPGVFALSKDMEWVPAVDPLHFDKPQIAGVGLGRSFARTLLEFHPNASIGLVPAAFGGTSLDEWKPGGKLYEDAVKRAKFAMKSGKLRGILWHQGEADSSNEAHANSYDTRWAAMITKLRADLGEPDVPVLVGQLGEFQTYPFRAKVDEQIVTLPLRVAHTGFVSSAGLTSNPDHIHFDARSQREFGRRYALAFVALDPDWASRK